MCRIKHRCVGLDTDVLSSLHGNEAMTKVHSLNDKKFTMKTDFPLYIPIANTTAGGSLTPANWQEIGIHIISYSLETLLVKPGIKLLYSIPDFKNYIGWQGQLVLNASNFPPANTQGNYRLRSVYDGSLIQVEKKELIELILHLKPDFIIWPQDFLETDPILSTITPFVSLPHKPELNHLKLNHDKLNINDFYIQSGCLSSVTEETEETIPNSQALFCMAKAHSFTNLLSRVHSVLPADCLKQKILYVESDLPAQDALEGKIYLKQQAFHSHEECLSENNPINWTDPLGSNSLIDQTDELKIIDLCDPEKANQHEVIDANCQCPTCANGFTQAYLHYLFLSTPLLCYRFLIQHNAYTYAYSFTKA